MELLVCRVEAKLNRRRMPYEETLVVIRYVDEEGTTKIDDSLSDAPADTPLREFARVSKAAHRIEECIKRCKSESGLADDVEPVGERAERSSQLERLASSSDSVAAGVLVSDRRITSGKKTDSSRSSVRRLRKCGHADLI